MYKINRHKFYMNIIYVVFIVVMLIQERIVSPYFTTVALFNNLIPVNGVQNYIFVMFDRLIIIIVLVVICLVPNVRKLIFKVKEYFENYINGFIITQECIHTSENREEIELANNSSEISLQEMEEKKYEQNERID